MAISNTKSIVWDSHYLFSPLYFVCFYAIKQADFKQSSRNPQKYVYIIFYSSEP